MARFAYAVVDGVKKFVYVVVDGIKKFVVDEAPEPQPEDVIGDVFVEIDAPRCLVSFAAPTCSVEIDAPRITIVVTNRYGQVMREFHVGDRPQVTVRCKTVGGALVSPDAVFLSVVDEEGTPLELTIDDATEVSDGVFVFNFDVNTAGNWTIKAQCSGGLRAASDDEQITVKETRFAVLN